MDSLQFILGPSKAADVLVSLASFIIKLQASRLFIEIGVQSFGKQISKLSHIPCSSVYPYTPSFGAMEDSEAIR